MYSTTVLLQRLNVGVGITKDRRKRSYCGSRTVPRVVHSVPPNVWCAHVPCSGAYPGAIWEADWVVAEMSLKRRADFAFCDLSVSGLKAWYHCMPVACLCG